VASSRAVDAAAAVDAALIARLERVPFTRWHLRARIIVGSATFFDAFDALSLAFGADVGDEHRVHAVGRLRDAADAAADPGDRRRRRAGRIPDPAPAPPNS
jgi:hypothetical protein